MYGVTGMDMADKTPTNTRAQSSEADRALRRRILRAGLIGAPVVLTFRGTSAWAVSAGCLVKEGTHPIPGQIIRVDENFQPIPKPGVDVGQSNNNQNCGNNGNHYGNGGKNKDKGNATCNGNGNGNNNNSNSNLAWYDQYETVFVTQDPFGAAADRVADRNTDINGLRALVYNGNIGITCLASIQGMAS